MAENKKSFVLYCDQQNIFKMLPDDLAGKLIKHIFAYVNDENPETNDLVMQLAFEPIKMQLKRDLRHWDEIREKRSENGKLGGRPKKQTEAKKANGFLEKQTKAKKAVNVNDNVTVNVNDNDINNLFDEFWDAYPVKTGKIHAGKIFNKLSAKVQQQVIDHVRLYANWKPFETYRHANPTTYLNQKRYLDDLPNNDKSANDKTGNPKWLIADGDNIMQICESEEHANAALEKIKSQLKHCRYQVRFEPNYKSPYERMVF